MWWRFDVFFCFQKRLFSLFQNWKESVGEKKRASFAAFGKAGLARCGERRKRCKKERRRREERKYGRKKTRVWTTPTSTFQINRFCVLFGC
jgi:hypothetical protein